MKKLLTIVALALCATGLQAQSITKGYRGYYDLGYSQGIGDYTYGRIELNTAQGYQFSPYFFMGAGVGLHYGLKYTTDDSDWPFEIRDAKIDIPVFANMKVFFSKGTYKWFADARFGTYFTNNSGLYGTAAFGCRFPIEGWRDISVSLGYSMAEYEYEMTVRHGSLISTDWTRKGMVRRSSAISLKVGVDF